MVQVESPTSSGGGFFVAEHHQDFLDRLAKDDALRTSLVTDPAGTLARFGIAVDPASIPAAVTLPASDRLESSLEALDRNTMDRILWFPFLGD